MTENSNSKQDPFRLFQRVNNRYGIERGTPADDRPGAGDLFDAAQVQAEAINRSRDADAHPDRAVRAGEVSAICLLDVIFHHLTEEYRRRKNPRMWDEAVEALREGVGDLPLDHTLSRFIEDLPGLDILPGEESAADYLESRAGDTPPRPRALNELLLLDLGSRNPAFHPLRELFDDRMLRAATSYPEVIRKQEEFYRQKPCFGPENLPLPEFLRMPLRAAPDSLPGQLDYIKENWSELLRPELLESLMVTRDIIKEEEKLRLAAAGPVTPPVWMAGAGGDEFGAEYANLHSTPESYERFSPDLDWMPRVVLMVKNAYVWLNQLSRRYRRPITRLDQIPDREFDRLARWGYTGFWLIGLWERSPASRKIKHICGTPEADASA